MKLMWSASWYSFEFNQPFREHFIVHIKDSERQCGSEKHLFGNYEGRVIKQIKDMHIYQGSFMLAAILSH